MKIRIKGNAIRLRLTKTEVETFCKTGRFEEQTHFGDLRFTYALQAKQNIDTLDASFSEDTITVFLNERESKDWYQTNQVGFSEVVKRADGTTLSLLIEKDFACLDAREEDQSDNYTNPNASSAAH